MPEEYERKRSMSAASRSDHLRRRIRLLLLIVIAGLALSGP